MKTDEIVGALRSCSNHDTRKPDCDNCPLFGVRLCVKEMLEGGADLIESLQAQLLQKTQQLAESQRREKAALEDLYNTGYCGVCKHYDPENNTCAIPLVESDKCFVWRGPQEAGEEEKE
jgi:hypothetical protein